MAGVVLGAAAGSGVLVEVFKHLYQRARPPAAERLVAEPSFSLPSGHALGSMVVLGVLAASKRCRLRGTVSGSQRSPLPRSVPPPSD